MMIYEGRTAESAKKAIMEISENSTVVLKFGNSNPAEFRPAVNQIGMWDLMKIDTMEEQGFSARSLAQLKTNLLLRLYSGQIASIRVETPQVELNFGKIDEIERSGLQ